MRHFAIVSFVLLAALLPYGPVALAQQSANSEIDKPGLEVPLITPGPRWKTCPRCKNEAYAAADRKKANVDARPFNKHDISGVWSGTTTGLDDNGSTLDLNCGACYYDYLTNLESAHSRTSRRSALDEQRSDLKRYRFGILLEKSPCVAHMERQG
jgi:hypothetical protein